MSICFKLWDKWFLCLILSKSRSELRFIEHSIHTTFVKLLFTIVSLLHTSNWISERLSHSLIIPQLLSGQAEIWTQVPQELRWVVMTALPESLGKIIEKKTSAQLFLLIPKWLLSIFQKLSDYCCSPALLQFERKVLQTWVTVQP